MISLCNVHSLPSVSGASTSGYSYFYLSRINFAKISSRERYVFLFFFVFLFAIVLALAFFLEMASSHEKIFI
jgi:hypothetical protein